VNLADDIFGKGELEQAQYYFMRYFLSRDIEHGKSIVFSQHQDKHAAVFCRPSL